MSAAHTNGYGQEPSRTDKKGRKWGKIQGACPSCGHEDGWCRQTEDGQINGCRRKSAGAYKTIRDKDGVEIHLHQLDASRALPPLPAKTKPSIPRGDVELVARVYAAMFDALELSAADRADLKRRGLTDEEIDRRQYRSAPDRRDALPNYLLDTGFKRSELLSVPGFYCGRHGGILLAASEALLIPVRDVKERIVAVRMRLYKPVKGKGKYRWLSSANKNGPGPGVIPHIPLKLAAVDPHICRLTEGELKADISTDRSGILTISAPGVAIWRPAFDVARALGFSTIRLAFDRDAETNHDVARCLAECAITITKAGMTLEVETWDPSDGKGVDDVLSAGKPVRIVRGDEALKMVRAITAKAAADHAAKQETETKAKANNGPSADRDDGNEDQPEVPDELLTNPDVLRARVEALVATKDLPGFLRDKGLLRSLAHSRAHHPAIFMSLKAELLRFRNLTAKDLGAALDYYKPTRNLRPPNTKADPAGIGEPLKPGESITDPHWLARSFLSEHCTHNSERSLIYHRKEFLEYDGGRYVEYLDAEEDLAGDIKTRFDAAHEEALEEYEELVKAVGKDEAGKPPKLLQVSRAIVKDAELALRSETILNWHQDPPCWVGGGLGDELDPLDILPLRNVLLHLPTQRAIPHTPRFFTRFAVGYDWDPNAPQPERWNKFLEEVLPDEEARRELQKWFGLMLTLDTRYQKILMMIGPGRSGKGTILRVLTALIGPENVASPKLSGMARPFALSALVGKALCAFSDARALGGPNDRDVVCETLLNISGEDEVQIDRKYKDEIKVKLKTRLLFIGNQEPNFRDASGALIDRLLPLEFTKSFAKNPDVKLTDKLLEELPGILKHFAIPGLKLLREEGKFKVPGSSQGLLDRITETLRPAKLFADTCLDVIKDDDRDDDTCPTTADVFHAYVEWCADTKRKAQNDNIFAQNLRSAYPHIKSIRPGNSGSRPRRYQGCNLNDEGRAYLARATARQYGRGPIAAASATNGDHAWD